jgi:hypothetical protein
MVYICLRRVSLSLPIALYETDLSKIEPHGISSQKQSVRNLNNKIHTTQKSFSLALCIGRLSPSQKAQHKLTLHQLIKLSKAR